MSLDSDLLDVHLHAAEITQRGVRELVTHIQAERDLYRKTFTRVLDQIEDNIPNTTKDRLFEAFSAIQTELNESHWRASLVHIHWRDLDG